jgi:hypothetical protein
MPQPVARAEREHGKVEELLPWYATGELDAADRQLVAEHLATCADCQRRLAEEQRLMRAVRAIEPEVDEGWARLRNRIAAQPRGARRILVAANDAWSQVRRPGIAIAMAAQFAFVLFAAALFLSFSRPSYHALGAGTAPAAANVLVMFKPDATEQQVRELLRANGASLVGGPTDAAAYMLHVAPAARSAVLVTLRADREVVLAEAIDRSAAG